MAATTNPILSDFLKFQISTDSGTTWDTIALLTSFSVDPQTDTREINTFDQCSNKEFLPSKQSHTASFEALVRHTTATDFLNTADLYTLQTNSTVFDFRTMPIDCDGNDMAGDYIWSGSGFITGLPMNGSAGESATVSGSIQGTGAWSYEVAP